MLLIEKTGRIVHPKIKPAISHAIERGSMHVINGIVIHQTASPTAKATLNAYTAPDANGAHLLIDKDGSIYQTASIYQKTHHVGHIKSRCLAEHQCSPKDIKDLQGKRVGAQIGRVEVRKPFPQRYPFNGDSIGIEIVSMAPGGVFEAVTQQQQDSLSWLLRELGQALGISMSAVFRHSEISWKLETEGSSAKW